MSRLPHVKCPLQGCSCELIVFWWKLVFPIAKQMSLDHRGARGSPLGINFRSDENFGQDNGWYSGLKQLIEDWGLLSEVGARRSSHADAYWDCRNIPKNRLLDHTTVQPALCSLSSSWCKMFSHSPGLHHFRHDGSMIARPCRAAPTLEAVYSMYVGVAFDWTPAASQELPLCPQGRGRQRNAGREATKTSNIRSA